MDSLLFTADILKAKLKVLETGHAVTRRLDGLKEINQEPDRWKYRSIANIPSGFFFQHDNGLERTIHSKYHVGQVVYLKEAWATYMEDDVLRPSQVPAHFRIWYKAGDDGKLFTFRGKWRSPLFMPAWAARHFVKILSVKPERLDIEELPMQEIRREGGEPALKLLRKYNGLWLWRIEIEKTVRPNK